MHGQIFFVRHMVREVTNIIPLLFTLVFYIIIHEHTGLKSKPDVISLHHPLSHSLSLSLVVYETVALC